MQLTINLTRHCRLVKGKQKKGEGDGSRGKKAKETKLKEKKGEGKNWEILIISLKK